MTTNNKLVGSNGGRFYDSTATLTGDWYAIEMNADTVIASLVEANLTGDTTANALTEWAISGKTLSQGVIITPKREKFTSVALTSGSVILRNY